MLRKKLRAMCGEKISFKTERVMKIRGRSKVVLFEEGVLLFNGDTKINMDERQFNVTLLLKSKKLKKNYGNYLKE